MAQVVILCIEDEAEVRSAILRDLDAFAGAFQLESAEDVPEAEEVMAEVAARGDLLGLLLCDHVLPGETGVDFLIRTNENDQWQSVRKVLITGQAGHEDTIAAINGAHLDYYIEKPWKPEGLQNVVKEQLTEFVLTEPELDLLPYMQLLDGARLMEAIAQRGGIEG